VKIARNELHVLGVGTVEEIRAAITATPDAREQRSLQNELSVALARDAGGVPVRVYKRCTVQYGYKGLQGWYLTPWLAAAAYLELIGFTDEG